MTEQQKPCDSVEARQFDFWLGEWNLSWGEDGRGSNSITAILGGCVIQEQFDSAPADTFKGMSLSTFNQRSQKWHQTWVDNNGAYLDFTGRFSDDRMILSRQAILEDKPILQRMVWYNIKANELDWNWERSDDDGQSWQVVWHIHYLRK